MSAYRPELEKCYGFTQFAVELNEMEDFVAPTDSRHRPDQRCMEEGNWDEANRVKQLNEEKQRATRRQREKEASQAAELGQCSHESHSISLSLSLSLSLSPSSPLLPPPSLSPFPPLSPSFPLLSLPLTLPLQACSTSVDIRAACSYRTIQAAIKNSFVTLNLFDSGKMNGIVVLMCEWTPTRFWHHWKLVVAILLFSPKCHLFSLAGQEYVGYEPLWFKRETDPQTGNLIHTFNQEYWNCKEKQDWSHCPDIYV